MDADGVWGPHSAGLGTLPRPSAEDGGASFAQARICLTSSRSCWSRLSLSTRTFFEYILSASLGASSRKLHLMEDIRTYFLNR